MKRRVLTGDRPTGKLHLGHYVGSLQNRVRLQQDYDCLFVIADLHVLTTQPEKDKVARVAHHVREIVLDYLAAGIDPAKSTIFVQSSVPETYELNLLLAMLVSVPRLERLPSLKDMARDAGLAVMPFGLLGYPVLQAADILLPRAHLVPVARDNEAHVEVTREIARRFNRMYGDLFPLPEPLLEETLIGTDGQAKMSKSRGNAISLSDDEETVRALVMGMYTDPQRVRADLPGCVEDNPLFVYHHLFNADREEVNELRERYRQGKVGDVEVKQRLAQAINQFLEPIRERRARFEAQPGVVDDILLQGARRARALAGETMGQVRDAMGLYGPQLLKAYAEPVLGFDVPALGYI
jgi:tryptophanyl-tRNA synthetase